MDDEKKSHWIYQFGNSKVHIIEPQLKTSEEAAALLKEVYEAARVIIVKLRQLEKGENKLTF